MLRDFFKSMAVIVIRYWLGYKYRTKNLNIESGVTIFGVKSIGEFVRICRNSSFKKSKIGSYSYIGENCKFENADIGSYTSIGQNVVIVHGKHPAKKFVSTHPVFYSLRKQSGRTFVSKQKFDDFNFTKSGYSVVIGNDVWIGQGVKIIEGVSIGDGAIVGAYSLVTKDILPYSINVGMPAKKIGQRFDDSIIEWLMQFKWWNKDIKWIEEEAENFDDIEKLYNKYKK